MPTSTTTVEHVFATLDAAVETLAKERGTSLVEALTEIGDVLFQERFNESGINDLTKKRMRDVVDMVPKMDAATIQKAFHFALVKVMRQYVQPHHQMTPDSVGNLMVYIVQRLQFERENLRMLDLTVGTGHLLIKLCEGIPNVVKDVYGVDVDETLLSVCRSYANLCKQPMELFAQDSLQPLLIDPVDLAISDLPVGYYPDDDTSASFQTKATEGHSFSHHLLLEQSLNMVKDGGYGLFVVPNHLFTSKEAPILRSYLQKTVHILGLLELPKNMFTSSQHAKSILLVRKKGAGVQAPKEALLVKLPSSKHREAFLQIIRKINEWFAENEEALKPSPIK